MITQPRKQRKKEEENQIRCTVLYELTRFFLLNIINMYTG